MNTPTPSPIKPDDLDRELTEMTVWNAADQNLWKDALQSGKAAPARSSSWSFETLLSKPLSNRLMVAGIGCIALVFIVGLMMPSLGSTRTSGARVSAQLSYKRATPATDGKALSAQFPEVSGIARLADAHELDSPAARAVAASPPPTPPPSDQDGVYHSSESWKSLQAATSHRYVVQKATMDLQTDDVRAAFAKAAHLVSEAGGEFVENSSLTGDGKTAQGNMTLRVAAARVGEVMNKLRELGTVKSENTSGEDVTTQVVDVEARIRNEQRVEKELLDLLEKRHDAPLKDILELRSSLSSVRESIERLVGQRDRLGRLVSLASILVVIRAEPLIEKPAPASTIADYFVKSISRAWHGGLESLSDTVAWIIAVAIGGVMWWIVLTAVVVAIVRWRRRLSARCV